MAHSSAYILILFVVSFHGIVQAQGSPSSGASSSSEDPSTQTSTNFASSQDSSYTISGGARAALIAISTILGVLLLAVFGLGAWIYARRVRYALGRPSSVVEILPPAEDSTNTGVVTQMRNGGIIYSSVATSDPPRSGRLKYPSLNPSTQHTNEDVSDSAGYPAFRDSQEELEMIGNGLGVTYDSRAKASNSRHPNEPLPISSFVTEKPREASRRRDIVKPIQTNFDFTAAPNNPRPSKAVNLHPKRNSNHTPQAVVDRFTTPSTGEPQIFSASPGKHAISFRTAPAHEIKIESGKELGRSRRHGGDELPTPLQLSFASRKHLRRSQHGERGEVTPLGVEVPVARQPGGSDSPELSRKGKRRETYQNIASAAGLVRSVPPDQAGIHRYVQRPLPDLPDVPGTVQYRQPSHIAYHSQNFPPTSTPLRRAGGHDYALPAHAQQQARGHEETRDWPATHRAKDSLNSNITDMSWGDGGDDYFLDDDSQDTRDEEVGDGKGSYDEESQSLISSTLKEAAMASRASSQANQHVTRQSSSNSGKTNNTAVSAFTAQFGRLVATAAQLPKPHPYHQLSGRSEGRDRAGPISEALLGTAESVLERRKGVASRNLMVRGPKQDLALDPSEGMEEVKSPNGPYNLDDIEFPASSPLFPTDNYGFGDATSFRWSDPAQKSVTADVIGDVRESPLHEGGESKSFARLYGRRPKTADEADEADEAVMNDEQEEKTIDYTLPNTTIPDFTADASEASEASEPKKRGENEEEEEEEATEEATEEVTEREEQIRPSFTQRREMKRRELEMKVSEEIVERKWGSDEE